MDNNRGIAFEGATLEEAYEKASSAFECSLTDLKSEILQAPSNGFLGLFKKNAIIKVYECTKIKEESKQKPKNDIKIKDVSSQIESIHEDMEDETCEKVSASSQKPLEIFDDFYQRKNQDSSDQLLDEIKSEIDRLFVMLQYNVEPVRVEHFDENTIYIEFQGEDSALLIGKEGYRYKALSYILFNWIHEKYGKMIRLEIAEFLNSQEENMKKYLEPVIDTIKEEGYYKTKILDGILVHIALTQLREAFPDKYIAVKNNSRGEKYILVNEYRS